jgi:DNA (cytosine-5)-methyltransferase 1
MVIHNTTAEGSMQRGSGGSFTAAEFFAGIGLVRLALMRQSWQVIWANDIDAGKAELYHANFGASDLTLGDVHQIPAVSVPDCTLYTASFPCNDLSVAGAMSGLHGKESSAFWGLIRILKEKGERRPPFVLLENVLGFLMCDGGRDFESALLALCGLGYAVDALIINASSFVPQSRPRLFVIAKRCDGEQTANVAAESDIRPTPLVRFINLTPHIRWDIRRLPALPVHQHRLADIVEHLPDNDPHWWNLERSQYFMGQLSVRHEIAAKSMIMGKSVSYATAFRRVRHGRSMAELRTDGLAGCLRTPRGGSGRQILFQAGKGRYQVRLLTARECARLQGVPDDFKIPVPLNQALFGFGDAVCVPVVEWIVKHYLCPLAKARIPRPREVAA